MKETPKKKYRKNFLTNVICRLDFRSIDKIDKSFFEDFRAVIKSDFPKIQEQKRQGFTATFQPDKPSKIIHSNLPEIPVFKYMDDSCENVIILSNDHLSIESTNYIDFKTFKKTIELALGALIDIVNEPDFTRLGLRSINQIVLEKGNPFVWKGYLDPSFTSVVDRFIGKDKENIARAMSQIILNYDDYKVNFNFGMHNSEFPAKISRKEFILDFDFYTEFVERDGIYDLLKMFNKESAIMFENCIRQNLRKHMGVINE